MDIVHCGTKGKCYINIRIHTVHPVDVNFKLYNNGGH